MNIKQFTQKDSYFKNDKIVLGPNKKFNDENFCFSDQTLQISG